METNKNPEMRDLVTHQAGAVNLHETINRKETTEPAPAPGAVPEQNKENE